MRLLLDTHVLLSMIDDELTTLTPETAAILKSEEHDFAVSVASLWEIAIKFRLGKLQLSVPLSDLPRCLAELGCALLPVSGDQATAELSPWPPTNDPFDRLLLAVCQVLQLQLVTHDRALRDHPLAWRPPAGAA